MSFDFSQEQRDFIRARLLEGPRAGTVQFSDVYAKVAEWLIDVPGAQAVRSWFLGATQANSGIGPYATLIRAYTGRQAALRNVAMTDQLMQDASNAVAIRVLTDLLPEGASLTLEDIAERDATEVGGVVFASLQGDTALTANAAWVGSLLFAPMGSNQSGRLYSAGSPTSADTVDDWKNILFAYDSFVQAIKDVASWKSALHPGEIWDAGKIFLGLPGTHWSELAEDISSNLVQAGDYAWGPKLSRLFQGTAVEKPLAAMGRYGSAEALNMLMSAWLGRPTDVADEANLLTTAHAFFGSLGSSMAQSLPMALIEDLTVDEIRGAARTDIRYRNALQSLSVFLVEPQAQIAATLEMYAPAAGTGEITDAWLVARSHFLAYLNTYRSSRDTDGVLEIDPGLPLPVVGDALFVDHGTRPVQLTVNGLDLGLVALRKFLFGGLGGDALLGGDGDDSLFGMGGNDVLDGGQGDDHLEGGLGADELRGGENDDVLLGMDGADLLVGGAGNDDLQGGNGYDTYAFSSADRSQHDTVYDSDGAGTIVIDGITLGTVARLSSEVWQTTDARFRFMVQPAAQGAGVDLTVRDASNGSSVRVRNWANGSLGITLEGYGTAPQPPTALPPGTWDGGVVPYPGAVINGAHVGTAGNDALYAGFGDDVVEGGAGKDLISGGPGSDRISGGDGDDIIFEHSVTGRFGGFTDSSWLTNPSVVGHGPGWVALAANGGRQDARDYYQSLAVYGFYGPLHSGAFFYPDAELYPDQGDIIDGGAGSDIILGGEGDDLIQGGTGADVISGGFDNDMVFGEEGDDLIFGDQIDGELRDVETVNPSSKANINGNDYLDGGDGDDRIYGQGGSDYLRGGAGDDTLYGDEYGASYSGDDFLDGGDGNDYLYGGNGADILEGGDGHDRLDGEDGDDRLHGGKGQDWLYGGRGRDVYQFGRGDGRDSVMDGDNDSIIEMLDGIDPSHVAVRRSNSSLSISLPGTDDELTILDYFAGDPATSGVEIRFANGVTWNALVVSEMARRPSEDADTIIGTDRDDILYGAGGGDTIEGRGGNDTLFGGTGNDTLYGQGGSNTLHGDEGDDVLYASGGEVDLLFGGDGNDELFGNSNWSELYGGAGDDMLRSFNASGDPTPALMDGGSGNDYLMGGYGNDIYVFGRGYGKDSITATGYADAPNVDVLRFGEGIDPADLEFGLLPGTFGTMDVVIGIKGTADQVSITAALDLWHPGRVELSDGVRAIEFANGTRWEADQVRQAFASATAWPQELPIDIQLGTEAGDTIISASDNVSMAWGFAGDDVMHGGLGIDEFHGNIGNDALYGGAGDDQLTGGAGDDVLSGGTGNDILGGGDGSDTYLYSLGDGADIIDDFGYEPGTFPEERTGIDRLVFAEGIAPEDIAVSRVSSYDSTMVLSLKHHPGDTIQVGRQFETGTNAPGLHAIEEIVFFDGTVWDIDAMAQRAQQTTNAFSSALVAGGSAEAALLIQAIAVSRSGKASTVTPEESGETFMPWRMTGASDQMQGTFRYVRHDGMVL